jgi:cardiolipin synthase
MVEAIEQAQSSVALEMYIVRDSEIGDRFRAALTNAAARAVRVRVLVDSFGSIELPGTWLKPISDAGGDCRWFNPLQLHRFAYRDHRKLMIVDEQIAFIGGYNIAPEYDGDGVTTGWQDVGMLIRDPTVVAELSKGFNAVFGAASFRHRRLARFRRHLEPQRIECGDSDLFLLSPGRSRNPVRDALLSDIRRSKFIALTSGYMYLPRSLRRALVLAVRRGSTVQLILGAKSDVRLAQLAARGQYSYLLRGGVQVFEYQPAVVHAKRYLLDDVLYVGSANLDLRSLNINYELLLRTRDASLAAEGLRHFIEDLDRCKRITRETWRQRSWWNRMAERLAGMVLVRLDLRLSLWQLSRLRRRGGPLRLGSSQREGMSIPPRNPD